MDLKHVSTLVGWVYVIIWGVSNYPPVISNWQLRSVQGISIDYMYFNMMGFILYTLYTSTMWASPLVRKEFFEENGLWPLIRLNDVIFGVHNMCTNAVVLSQAYCWGFKRNDNQKLSSMAKIILSIVASYLIGGGCYIYHTQKWESVPNVFNWMHLFTSLGLVKIGMSVCKNIPQIMYNYNRKSTHGWPILMIWLDFVGAFLSFLQLLIDAHIAGDMTAIFDNKPKLFLAFQVFLADSVFFLQHYYLYYEGDVKQYGPFKADIGTVAHGHAYQAYQSIVQEDEDFLIEHAHDHDHLIPPVTGHSQCAVSSTDKNELQRLLSG